MLSSHCGQLEIDRHSSQFAVVFREGAVSRYQAISLHKQEGDETRCHVAVTYAFPLWHGVSAGTVTCTCVSSCASSWLPHVLIIEFLDFEEV